MTSEKKQEDKLINVRPEFLNALISDLEATPQVARYLMLRGALAEALKADDEEEVETVTPEIVE